MMEVECISTQWLVTRFELNVFFYSLKFSILECLVDVTTSLLSLIKRGVLLYLRSSGKCDIQV